MSSVPLMALRNSERRSDEAHDSDQISDEEDEPLESVLANMKYRYGNRNKYKRMHGASTISLSDFRPCSCRIPDV